MPTPLLMQLLLHLGLFMGGAGVITVIRLLPVPDVSWRDQELKEILTNMKGSKHGQR